MKSISMTHRLLVLIVALIIFIPTVRADELRALPDDNLAYPVLLQSERVDGRRNMGSGFYYDEGKAIYFVTARHVLFSATSTKLTILPNKLHIPYHLISRLSYDAKKKELHFVGVMSKENKFELIGSTPNQALFKKAVE
jgi:S1-C subfamily serine protease